jgi:hypothetical protein
MCLSAVGYPIIDYDYRLFAFVRSVGEQVLKTNMQAPNFPFIFLVFDTRVTQAYLDLLTGGPA